MTNAQVILAQLGGNKFLAMTGAKNLQSSPFAMSFRLTQLSGLKSNYVKIVLDSATDLYSVEIGRVRGANYTVLSQADGIYAEQLKGVVANGTGRALSL